MVTTNASSSMSPKSKTTEWLHQCGHNLHRWVTDKRLIAFVGCLFIGSIIKWVVFSWSVSVVEIFQVLRGQRTHGYMLRIGDHLVLEHFDDWHWYYEAFVDSFLQGHLLYTPELYEIVPGVQGYIYPPLFLYLIVAFELLPGQYSLVGGIVFFDLITGGCVFLAALRVTNATSRASLAALIYYLNPIALWWTDFCWFGEALFTGFTVLGFLCLLENRLGLASVFLGLAVMIKQVAVIFLPLLLILAYQRSWRSLLTSITILATIILLLSMPYLVIMPSTYLEYIFLGARPFLYIDAMPPYNSPIQLFASFWFLPAPIRNVIAIAVYTYGPLLGLLTLTYFFFLFTPEPIPHRRLYKLVTVALLISLSFYTFFPRGIFKWYLVAIIPYFALAVVCIPRRWLSRVPTWNQAISWQQRILALLNSRITFAVILYFLTSFALTWCHRWLGPGILLLCLIGYIVYWLGIGRHTSFAVNLPSHEFLSKEK